MRILFVSFCVRIPRQVKPQTSPSFSVARVLQQAINEYERAIGGGQNPEEDPSAEETGEASS